MFPISYLAFPRDRVRCLLKQLVDCRRKSARECDKLLYHTFETLDISMIFAPEYILKQEFHLRVLSLTILVVVGPAVVS